MINKKILAGILAASLAAVPLITTYASMPDIEDVSYASDDEKEEEAPKVDKAANFQNSVNLTDEVAKGDETSNVMFSPTSLNFALGMIAEGAKGDTKKVLSDYLGTNNFTEYAKYYLKAAKYFNPGDKEQTYGYSSKLKIADALWLNKGLTLKDAFKKNVSDNFNAEAQVLDFSDKKKTCNIINKWCNESTEGLISEIVKPEAINQDSKLFLTNSLYFESGWSSPWELSDKEEKFGAKEKTKYMESKGDVYYENDAATAFGKSYANGLEFIGIMPKNEDDFTLDSLDIKDLLKSEPEYDEVYCKMPKLNFETTAELSDILSNMGLKNIFSNKADFSVISDEKLKVGSVLQKTKLELDENGTKAAAVTSISMETCSLASPDPIVKNVDLTRPFAFLIYDSTNDEVLFMGKVVTLQ